MFGTRKRLNELAREMEHLQLTITRLREDLNLAQVQLLLVEEWGDDSVKTRQVAHQRALDLPSFHFDAALHSEPQFKPGGADGPTASGVRRRVG